MKEILFVQGVDIEIALTEMKVLQNTIETHKHTADEHREQIQRLLEESLVIKK